MEKEYNCVSEETFERIKKAVQRAGMSIIEEADKIVGKYSAQCDTLEIRIIIDDHKGINPYTCEVIQHFIPAPSEEMCRRFGIE